MSRISRPSVFFANKPSQEEEIFSTVIEKKLNSEDSDIQQWLDEQLFIAVRYRHTYEYRVKMLLEAGASVHARNKEGQTPLHLVSFHQRRGGPPRPDETRDIIQQLLLEAGADGSGAALRNIVADPNARDNEGNTCGHIAAEGRGDDTINLYRKYGLDVSIKNYEGKTVADVFKTGTIHLD